MQNIINKNLNEIKTTPVLLFPHKLNTSELFNKKLRNQKHEVTVALCALKTFKLDY